MASPIIVDIPHQLGVDEARRRIDRGFGRFAREVGGSLLTQVSYSWIGDRLMFSFGAMGQVISGTVQVRSELVRVELVLPAVLVFVAKALRGRVEKEGRL